MHQYEVKLSILAVGILFLLVGCTADNPVDSELNATEINRLTSEVNPSKNYARFSVDEQFAEIARQEPSFGGLFFDDTGVLNLVLTDVARETAVRSIISKVAGSNTLLSSASSRVKKAEYNFLELKKWRDLIVRKGFIDGISILDIDEKENRVRISLKDESFSSETYKMLAKLRIPKETVIVDFNGVAPRKHRTEAKEAPDMRVPTIYELDDAFRPLIGGLRIADTAGYCTLGWIATQQGVLGAVINSHCTTVLGSVDNGVWYQNVVSPSLRIGEESIDPSFLPGGACPIGSDCRYSDASFVDLDITESSLKGTIAGTLFRSSIQGSTTIDDPIDIREEWRPPMSLPYMGLTLDKVGPVNGWVYGNVTGSSVIAEVPPSGELLLEQYKSDMTHDEGESGAPIFLYSPTGIHNAWLFGIAWGKIRFTGEVLWSFYPFVDTEIGPLESCSGTNCGIF